MGSWSSIAEIERDPALRYFGAALALCHLLTFAWWQHEPVSAWIASTGEAICWPIFPACASLKLLSPTAAEIMLWLYGVAALLVAGLFLKKPRSAWLGLLLLCAVKAGIMLLDFRLRMNQHYMTFWASGVFLFWPHKRASLRLLVLAFYTFAGLLKLNGAWLSGAWLPRERLPLSGTSLMLASAYVVLLELLIAPLMLARRRSLFWLAFGQILIFHACSWPIVDFFYPLTMLLLITIFPLCRALGADHDLPGSLLRGKAPRSVYAIGVGFACFQLVPHLYPGDTALTGEGRLYALHMFDAPTACEAFAELHHAGGGTSRRDLKLTEAPRIACDPVLFYNRARNLCRLRERAPRLFEDLDLYVSSRRLTEPRLRPVVAARNFCSRGLRYDPFVHNDWIETAPLR